MLLQQLRWHVFFLMIQILDGDWFACLKRATRCGAHVGGQGRTADYTFSPSKARDDEQVSGLAPILQHLHVVNLNGSGNLKHRLIKEVCQFIVSSNLADLDEDTNMASDFFQRDAL